MLHTIDSDILFLQQEEVIKAGLLDMKQVLAAVTELYQMMGKGLVKNPPKLRTRIPEDDNWTSFHNAMPCYIAGDYNISGIKWASESKKNAKTPGIPYGIDITILSDPETVLPFCILDGTIITAMRTAAVGGLLGKFVAPSDTKVATLVGAGVIGRCMIAAVKEAVPSVEKMYICDLDMEKAKALCNESTYKDKVELIPCSDTKEACLKAQLIETMTTASKPIIFKDMVPANCGLVSMASDEIDLPVVEHADVLCIDYWKQMITYKGKAVTQLYEMGKITQDDVAELGDLTLGRKQGRTSDDQFCFATSMGLGSLDIMIGYKMYLNAVKMGLGTHVKLWDKPLWE